jgi:hypothetical protein
MNTNKRRIEALESRIAPAFAGTLNLGFLSGSGGASPGFRLDGNLDADSAGFTVADAGDVNGDGFSDLIVGAPNAEVNGSTPGAAYVIFGDNEGFSPILDLGSLDGTKGFIIEGIANNSQFGHAVAGVGDVNGDGFDDIAIGAPFANGSGGSTVVLFGKSTSFGPKFDLATLNGANGFQFFGNQIGEFSGGAVSAAGDINGDGYGDVLIGASGHDILDNGSVVVDGGGAAYVLYGHNGTFFSVQNALSIGLPGGVSGFILTGVSDGDGAGFSVRKLGDFNGDGFDDFLVGASSSDSQGVTNNGRTYVVYGKAADFPSSMSLGNVAGPGGDQIVGISAGDGLGVSVHAAGDVNGDGLADLIVGATSSDVNGSSSGEAYVVYGRPGVIAGSINAANADIRIQGIDANDFLGSAVSGIGDFNGDGYGDLLVGAPGLANEPGASYVLFGRPDGFTNPINVSSLDGTAGFKINGAAIGDEFGSALSAAGDVNGDGYADLIVGAPDAGPTDAGRSYVVFGSNGSNFVEIGSTGKTATYTDADGDLVTIKVSKGTLDPSEFQLGGANYLGGATLQKVNFAGHDDLQGANVTISAKPQVIDGVLRGDGKVNVGDIEADSINFGAVKIAGDLGRIFASSAKTLTVDSFGSAGLSTQAGMGASSISVIGGLPKLTVKTNVENVTIASSQLGIVKIGGDLENSVLVLSGSAAPSVTKPAVALKKLTIGGDIDHSQILGGASVFGGNPDVAIGKVLVKGDWLASSLSAGVVAGPDQRLGTSDDVLYPGGSADISSRIASVVIKGQAVGTIEPGGFFAITAESIGSLKVGNTGIALSSKAKDAMLAIGSTGDFVINEI